MKPNDFAVLRVADENLKFRDVPVAHTHPTGTQILAAAGISQQQSSILLQILTSGELESIRLSETPNLSASLAFIVGEGDRSYFFTVNDMRLEWSSRQISGATIRKVAKVSDDLELVQVLSNGEPAPIEAKDMVNLDKSGLERMITRPRTWKLRVQGVTLTYSTPQVKVADAMKEAGFDPNKGWNIFLMVAGQSKQAVDVNYVVDLRTPGLEKIRLMQRNVDNGDGRPSTLRRDFELLAVDKRYLDGTGYLWETILCGSQRWLVIQNYQLPSGYTLAASSVALDIPLDYPTAQLDMFYFAPRLSRSDGQPIPATEATVTIEGTTYQRWSRHRNGSNPWDPYTDNVATQLALVDFSLAREFGE